MNIDEVKDLMQHFEDSTLREFSWTNETDSLHFSKNELSAPTQVSSPLVTVPIAESKSEKAEIHATPETLVVEGEAVASPLVGVAYLKPAPDKPDFVKVGDSVKKGQTLLIIEAMKVMNEIPAPIDGVITEILVAADEVVEYGQELVRIK